MFGNKINIKVILVLWFTCTISTLFSQNDKSSYLGLEIQAYPTGIIPGIRYEKNISEYSSVHFRLGYQWIRHRDLGMHDDERGIGYGFSIGYKQYFRSEYTGFSFSLRNDIWWNKIDWTTTELSPDPITGTTKVTVLQPTLLSEYSIRLNSGCTFIPSLGFGYEWNVRTDGEATGEGAIILIGISLCKKI